MAALVVLDAEPDDVDRPRIERRGALAFGRADSERCPPLGRRVALEIHRRAPVVQAEERRELEVRRLGQAACPESRLRRIDRDHRGKRVVADQRRLRALEGRLRGSEVRGEHERAVQQGHGRGIVGCRLEPRPHRQVEFDRVAGPPRAPQAQIAVRAAHGIDGPCR